MKNKGMKIISGLIIVLMVFATIMPTVVKSAQVVVSSMSDTNRGIGNTNVFIASIKGYSNIYCIKGGAHLYVGTQLNDDKKSLYTANISNITSNQSALAWVLDNMYLTDVTDAETKTAMKNNLKSIIKKYSTYKASNGKYILSQKINVNNIDDAWINKAVDALVSDKDTLYAVQQYVMWSFVKNSSSSYNSTMENSDGSYNSLPNAKADKKYYTALYISLRELAKEAQKNKYSSPNGDEGFDVVLTKNSKASATVQSDKKTVIAGPYVLRNNHSLFTKTFSATVNSNKVDKIETVDKNGKSINVSEKNDAFYLKITYNKGFEKGTQYKIKVNVNLKGYRTFASLLNPVRNSDQPLATIRKEKYTKQTSTELIFKENLEGNYGLQIEKVDATDTNTKISGAIFKVSGVSEKDTSYGPSKSDGIINIFKNRKIKKEGTEEFTISEVTVTDGNYIKLKDDIKIYVTTTRSNDKYVASKVSFEKDKNETSKEVTLEDGSKVTVTARISQDTVIVTIPNKQVEGKYSLLLEKVDSSNIEKKISGVSFKVSEEGKEAKTYGPTSDKGLVTIFRNKEITGEQTSQYTIKEVDIGNNNYIKMNEEVKVYITTAQKDNKYVVSNVSFEKDSNVTTKEVSLEDGTKVNITAKLSSGVVKITIPNKPVNFDLALRKYITEVKKNETKVEIGESRVPTINEKSVEEYKANKTAGYYHTKTPVNVKPGDNIIYTLRVYNEGNINGFAKEITDYLPAGLEFVTDSKINKENNWVVTSNNDGTTTVKTDKLKDTTIKPANGEEGLLEYVKQEKKSEAPEFSAYVEIECKVKADIQDSKLLVNVAEITNYGYNNKNGDYVEANEENVDIDSEENNVFNKDEKVKNIDEYYKNIVEPQKADNNNYYKGMQDDDDFENILVVPDAKEFKFVLNKVDESGNPLIGADFTVQKTKNEKTEVLLDNQEVKGTYEVLENNVKFNETYTYTVLEVESAPEYVNVMNGKYITLRTYMNEDGKLILGNYNKNEEEDALISKYGFVINNTDGSIVKETETDLYEKIKVIVKNDITPSQVVITIPNEKEKKEFDLALRKFITEVKTGVGTENEKQINVTDRVPTFKIDNQGKYVYEHTKEPVIVANNNIVTYTLRVYNEGTMDGYAKQIKDNIPEGLEFLPSNEVNQKYKWVMLDKYGKETTEVENAKSIVSNYLSKEHEKTAGENLLKAFDIERYKSGEIKEPDYKEVKVSFKVNSSEKSEKIIINKAQISDDSDKDGNKVDDRDSIPDVWNEGEDDQDIEKVKLLYFDLALRKWVTKAIVIENGTQTVTETGHTAEDNPEEIVKVDLKKSNIKNVTVKFEYSIRVKNEGQIEGYAKEISDYIPEGLKFVKEDNPDWKEVDGKVVTDKLKDTLLKPGDTKDVTITLTWINNENNMGLKVNTAEISKDYNEYGTPDIDSTPNNKVPGEDDIDDAPVMLTVKTGQAATYAGVTVIVLTILAGGIISIKKFVLK